MASNVDTSRNNRFIKETSKVALITMHLKWKLFPLSKLHAEIEPFKVAWRPPLLDELTSYGQR